jgi:hypothetical protein
MTILDLLRNNGIKEGHRPGIECPFLAQWHQKLHSNTTSDDIAIAEAYLHFLHGSGDFGDFWWHLWEHHRLSPVRLRFPLHAAFLRRRFEPVMITVPNTCRAHACIALACVLGTKLLSVVHACCASCQRCARRPSMLLILGLGIRPTISA